MKSKFLIISLAMSGVLVGQNKIKCNYKCGYNQGENGKVVHLKGCNKYIQCDTICYAKNCGKYVDECVFYCKKHKEMILNREIVYVRKHWYEDECCKNK